MNILENISLAPYTTFKIGGPAKYFCIVTNEEEIMKAVQFAKDKSLPFFVLGGGSNILISDLGFNGLVIKMEIKGKEYRSGVGAGEEEGVSVGAGEEWDGFVGDTVLRGLYGLENLSSIPGTVGAAPVQNIGAYGREVSQVIQSVRVLEVASLQFVELSKEECLFDYRDSIFKKNKGKYIITKVDFVLSKVSSLNMDYKDIKEYFVKNGVTNPTLQQLRQAIVDIRSSKLPDWNMWGTAGSYFKNPTISAEKFAELKNKYTDLLGFPEIDGKVKVSLGWIIENICKMKGLTIGNVGIYEKHALVFVAKPGATAAEIISLAKSVIDCVKEKTGIAIEAEVEWVN
ncbi:MAG: UDP-N-acetylmuramate dehydrogenase [Candidatus Paceibacterota bacterium]|jgi:UDP-N-acetylmuramate dehydrogenase